MEEEEGEGMKRVPYERARKGTVDQRKVALDEGENREEEENDINTGKRGRGRDEKSVV